MLRVWEGDNGVTEQCSFRVVLHRGGYSDCTILTPLCRCEQMLDPLGFKRGRLQRPRARAAQTILLRTHRQRGSHQHCHQRGQWKLKQKAALRQWWQRLRFWDASRMPRHYWRPSTTRRIRRTWTLVPEDALFSVLLHPSLSPLSPQASRLSSLSCSYLRWSWQSTQGANHRLLRCLRTLEPGPGVSSAPDEGLLDLVLICLGRVAVI